VTEPAGRTRILAGERSKAEQLVEILRDRFPHLRTFAGTLLDALTFEATRVRAVTRRRVQRACRFLSPTWGARRVRRFDR
jgi:hypothetical protein